MNKETFINQMTARGYELETVGNGNTNATKGDIVERAYRLAIDETLIENELEKREEQWINDTTC